MKVLFVLIVEKLKTSHDDEVHEDSDDNCRMAVSENKFRTHLGS